MLNAKYTRRCQLDVITKAQTFKAGGCHSWIVINRGNTNVTLGGTLVLEPGASLSSPNEMADVKDDTEFDVAFDLVNDPTIEVIDTGSIPKDPSYIYGVDPVPAKANKLVIVRSYLQ